MTVTLPTRDQTQAEWHRLRKMERLAIQFTRLFEAIDRAHHDDEGDAHGDAIDALFTAERDLCRRVMTLAPLEFPKGGVK